MAEFEDDVRGEGITDEGGEVAGEGGRREPSVAEGGEVWEQEARLGEVGEVGELVRRGLEAVGVEVDDDAPEEGRREALVVVGENDESRVVGGARLGGEEAAKVSRAGDEEGGVGGNGFAVVAEGEGEVGGSGIEEKRSEAVAVVASSRADDGRRVARAGRDGENGASRGVDAVDGIDRGRGIAAEDAVRGPTPRHERPVGGDRHVEGGAAAGGREPRAADAARDVVVLGGDVVAKAAAETAVLVILDVAEDVSETSVVDDERVIRAGRTRRDSPIGDGLSLVVPEGDAHRDEAARDAAAKAELTESALTPAEQGAVRDRQAVLAAGGERRDLVVERLDALESIQIYAMPEPELAAVVVSRSVGAPRLRARERVRVAARDVHDELARERSRQTRRAHRDATKVHARHAQRRRPLRDAHSPLFCRGRFHRRLVVRDQPAFRALSHDAIQDSVPPPASQLLGGAAPAVVDDSCAVDRSVTRSFSNPNSYSRPAAVTHALCCAPAATRTTTSDSSPATRPAVASRPSCPSFPRPNDTTSPNSVAANVCDSPHATETILLPPKSTVVGARTHHSSFPSPPLDEPHTTNEPISCTTTTPTTTARNFFDLASFEPCSRHHRIPFRTQRFSQNACKCTSFLNASTTRI